MPKRRDEPFSHLPGITLFHAARSNCSARVRLLLEEKSLDWNSRPVSLQAKENRSAAYFAINPKGLVPSLIHDGWVITESNEILYYLEATFPHPGFIPTDNSHRAAMERWMDLSAAIHLPGIKTLNYSRMAPAAATPSSDMENYRALQTDPELLVFHEKVSGSGFSAEDRSQAQTLLQDALGELDATLAAQSWLAGETYSLADICWVTTIPTLIRAGFDLTPFSHVQAWHKRIAARPAYAKALTDWENAPR